MTNSEQEEKSPLLSSEVKDTFSDNEKLLAESNQVFPFCSNRSLYIFTLVVFSVLLLLTTLVLVPYYLIVPFIVNNSIQNSPALVFDRLELTEIFPHNDSVNVWIEATVAKKGSDIVQVLPGQYSLTLLSPSESDEDFGLELGKLDVPAVKFQSNQDIKFDCLMSFNHPDISNMRSAIGLSTEHLEYKFKQAFENKNFSRFEEHVYRLGLRGSIGYKIIGIPFPAVALKKSIKLNFNLAYYLRNIVKSLESILQDSDDLKSFDEDDDYSKFSFNFTNPTILGINTGTLKFTIDVILDNLESKRVALITLPDFNIKSTRRMPVSQTMSIVTQLDEGFFIVIQKIFKEKLNLKIDLSNLNFTSWDSQTDTKEFSITKKFWLIRTFENISVNLVIPNRTTAI